MTEKLTLRGVKRIENYTQPVDPADRLFTLKRPTTGKDQFTLKRWWTEQGTRTPKRYINCTCFDTTVGGEACIFAVMSNQDTRLDIILDIDTFTFGETHAVERMALFSSDFSTLLTDFIVPKVPGTPVYAKSIEDFGTDTAGPAVDVTVDDYASNETKGSSVSGKATTATKGTGTGLTVGYSITQLSKAINMEVTSGGSGYLPGDTFTVTDDAGVTGVVVSVGTPPPPAPDTTVDSATVSGEASPTEGDTETYTVAVTGDATPYTYAWTVSDEGELNSGDGTNSISVIWNAAGTGSVACEVGSTNANFDGSTQTDTLSVTVGAAFAGLLAGADVSVAVTVADTGNGNKYQIDGVEQAEITANAEQTIHFDLSDSSLSGHPFKIYTDSSKTTEITVGIQQEGTDLLFTPPIAGTFSYQCGSHANMGGNIVVSA